eukprot:12274-Chlamydomonas_euryale.AAC.4
MSATAAPAVAASSSPRSMRTYGGCTSIGGGRSAANAAKGGGGSLMSDGRMRLWRPAPPASRDAAGTCWVTSRRRLDSTDCMESSGA